MFAPQHLRLRDRGICAAIRKRDTQSREVDTRLTRVPVNHRRISKILAESEVRREAVSM